MKRTFLGTLFAFGLGALAFGAIAVMSHIGRSDGAIWGSADGLIPMWPLSVGFGSLGLMALSVTLLVVLAVIGLIRDVRAKHELA
ncbi:hypothetical protein [Salinibacterium sp. PAMC 21357]|uniref:hypothetical protein n=1 Tax=Salinibacterium sp. PAMC 21357 TaxID=1112215 RepID=UPI00028A0174|nr:hypothetical protein [Salinibacterium sp. PAMC 21357]